MTLEEKIEKILHLHWYDHMDLNMFKKELKSLIKKEVKRCIGKDKVKTIDVEGIKFMHPVYQKGYNQRGKDALERLEE